MTGIRFSTYNNRKIKAPQRNSKTMTLIVRQFDDGKDLIIPNSKVSEMGYKNKIAYAKSEGGEFENPLPIVISKEPQAVPESNPVPFAEPPSPRSYWPVMTLRREGREVAFKATDGIIVGAEGRMFMANRKKGGKVVRYHVGVDLFGDYGDRVVACEDGKIINFYCFMYSGEEKKDEECRTGVATYALIVEHPNVVINYGEVAKDSLERAGLKIGDPVKAGQVIGYIGRNPGGSSMCHFEVYTKGTKSNKRWSPSSKRPPELLNPTKYLLYLQEHGLTISSARSQSLPSETGKSETIDFNHASSLNRPYYQEMGRQNYVNQAAYDIFEEYDIAGRGAEFDPAYSTQKSEDYIEYEILSRDPGNDYESLASKDLDFQNEGYVESFQDSAIPVTKHKVTSSAQSVPVEPPNSLSRVSGQESSGILKSAFRNEEKAVSDEEFMADLKSILGGQMVYDPISKKMVNKEDIVERRSEVPQRAEPPTSNEKELKPFDQKNEHEIFDRIAQSMAYANAYDLGSISLEKRFEDFDRLIELKENKKKSKKAANSVPKVTDVNNLPKLPSAFSSQDFIEDLNYITQNGAPTAQSSNAAPLENGIKGHSAEMGTLKETDSYSKEDTDSKQEISQLE